MDGSEDLPELEVSAAQLPRISLMLAGAEFESAGGDCRDAPLVLEPVKHSIYQLSI